MDKSKDNDQTFVIKILDDFRSRNRTNSLRMQYDTSIGLSTNDSLLQSNKRLRSCSPDMSVTMNSMLDDKHQITNVISFLLSKFYF